MNPETYKKKVSVDVGGREMVFETGWLAKQARGSVLVRYDNTAVLITCQNAAPRPGIDFFPLTVEYREKTGAAGKIPGGFFKREGRPTAKEILTCRLMDRPIRPLFPEGYKEEVQIIATVFSADHAHDPDICAMNGSPLAVLLAGLPFEGPAASVRVGKKDGKFIINPTYTERENAELDMVVAGTPDAITMVEAGCLELDEEEILQALELGHQQIKAICAAQLELCEMVKPQALEWQAPEGPDASLQEQCKAFYPAFREAVKVSIKHERKQAIQAAKEAAFEALLQDEGAASDDAEAETIAARNKEIRKVIGGYAYQAIRDTIIEEHQRIDGRKLDEIRPIVCEVQPFPRTHGSAIFTRGETQAFVNCTLGTAEDTQLVEGLAEKRDEHFLLHYNFPPFCTGEAKPLRGTSRREIGHGTLAERALRAVLPAQDDFPYTIRVVSDVLESNGSSSMATVCGGTLSMMDAGVPVRRPVAGIAMGLIKEAEEVRILSDILGDEDHCGDMDFKVCGTAQGITALQMDIKITGLSREIMEEALGQAKAGRLHILGVMNEALGKPREEISPYAPRYETCKVPVDKIGLVIGPGGKHIRGLQEETGATISIEDDGTVKIFAEDGEGALRAKEKIVTMTEDVSTGQYYEGKIVSIRDFGVFAEIKPGTEGLCHISEISDEYVDNLENVVEQGQVLKFKVINVEEGTGKVKLSRKAVILEDRGEEYVAPAPVAARSGGRSGGRRDGGGGRGRDGGGRRDGGGGRRDGGRGRGGDRGGRQRSRD